MKTPKTNPFNATGEPWIARQFAAIEFRCLVREVLDGKGRGLQDIENMLGSFAPSHVRGDFVPTIPEAYAMAVRIANTHEISSNGGLPVGNRRDATGGKMDSDLARGTAERAAVAQLNVQATPIFTPDGAFRVEVRLVPVCQPKGKQ